MRISNLSAPSIGTGAALTVLTMVTVWTIFQVPSWRGVFLDPCLIATIGAALTVALLWTTLIRGGRAIRLEYRWLALFLAAMPVVYFGRFFYPAHAGVTSSWLWIELLGIPIYGALGWLGLKRSPWFLSMGIALHGLGWDVWHYHRSAYIPDWYAVGCLVVDLALAAYVAVRIPALRESTSGASQSRIQRIRAAA